MQILYDDAGRVDGFVCELRDYVPGDTVQLDGTSYQVTALRTHGDGEGVKHSVRPLINFQERTLPEPDKDLVDRWRAYYTTQDGLPDGGTVAALLVVAEQLKCLAKSL
jgi:hypothetical protein